jgi:Tfp pilus assembly protein PilX
MIRAGCSRPNRQRGVTLFVALVVLVAMSLAGIALMRSVDTNILIAGNLAFRQAATAAADRGVEAARDYLTANTSGSTLWNDQAAAGYYATWQSTIDLIGTDPTKTDFNWNTDGQLVIASDAGSNEIRFVIHRICELAGDPNTTAANCVKTTTAASTGSGGSAGGTKGAVTYGSQALPGVEVIYYRVTVRVLGPRNTRSFVQAVLR